MGVFEFGTYRSFRFRIGFFMGFGQFEDFLCIYSLYIYLYIAKTIKREILIKKLIMKKNKILKKATRLGGSL